MGATTNNQNTRPMNVQIEDKTKAKAAAITAASTNGGASGSLPPSTPSQAAPKQEANWQNDYFKNKDAKRIAMSDQRQKIALERTMQRNYRRAVRNNNIVQIAAYRREDMLGQAAGRMSPIRRSEDINAQAGEAADQYVAQMTKAKEAMTPNGTAQSQNTTKEPDKPSQTTGSTSSASSTNTDEYRDTEGTQSAADQLAESATANLTQYEMPADSPAVNDVVQTGPPDLTAVVQDGPPASAKTDAPVVQRDDVEEFISGASVDKGITPGNVVERKPDAYARTISGNRPRGDEIDASYELVKHANKTIGSGKYSQKDIDAIVPPEKANEWAAAQVFNEERDEKLLQKFTDTIGPYDLHDALTKTKKGESIFDNNQTYGDEDFAQVHKRIDQATRLKETMTDGTEAKKKLSETIMMAKKNLAIKVASQTFKISFDEARDIPDDILQRSLAMKQGEIKAKKEQLGIDFTNFDEAFKISL